MKGALTADANKGAQANAATQGTQANDGTQAGINTTPVATVQGKCNPGFFEANGKCIQCPQGSYWNGTNCIKKV